MEDPAYTVVLSSFLRRLLCDRQVFCSVDCCKEHAFQLTEGSIGRWLDFERTDRTREIAAEIKEVASASRHVSGRIIMAVRGLESVWNAEQFREFWGRFQGAYTLAVESRQQSDD